MCTIPYRNACGRAKHCRSNVVHVSAGRFKVARKFGTPARARDALQAVVGAIAGGDKARAALGGKLDEIHLAGEAELAKLRRTIRERENTAINERIEARAFAEFNQALRNGDGLAVAEACRDREFARLGRRLPDQPLTNEDARLRAELAAV